MFRSIVLLFCILLVSRATADSCSASVTLVERPGSWSAGGIDHRIVDAHVANTGSTCTFSGTLKLNVALPPGSFVGYSWGWTPSTNSIVVPAITPGQTYSGIGFIVEGSLPSATVSSFENCVCPGDSSSEPTPTPTPSPNAPQYYFQKNPYVALPADPSAGSADVAMNVLVLACTGQESTQLLATLTLDSTGQPYDQVNFAIWGAGLLDLTYPDGSGRYYAIVAAVNPANCFNADQQSQISGYEITFKVRMVILYAFPSTTNGVDIAPIMDGNGAAAAGNATYVASTVAPFASTINTNASIPVSGVYGYPTILAPSATAQAVATPAMMMTWVNWTDTPYICAAFLKYTDGRRHMEYYIDQATWSFFSIVSSPLWVNWVTRGIYSGARRIVFNPHMDDVFMETSMWLSDELKEDSTDTVSYRINVTDLQAIVAWQADRVSRMPINSTFHLTFPFNGATVIQKGGYFNDSLYLYAKSVRDQFFWESHTWDHPILDDLNYTTVYNEWFDNNATALELFDNDLTNPIFNQHSVITPSISGLFNGEALHAMADLGIQNVCSDNSHKEQAPAFGYHGWYTNVTSNGWDGIYVVPRHATNIYFDAADLDQIVTQYNWLYNRTFNMEQIVQAEIEANVVNLLSFRHDPFMFHQANMKQIEYQGKLTSLMGLWVDAVVDAVMQYSVLPFWSMKHEDLAKELHLREDRDRCGFTARLHVSAAGQISGFYGASTQECQFGVTVPPTITPIADSRVTQEFMIDHTTMWINMAADSPITFAFNTPIDLTVDGW